MSQRLIFVAIILSIYSIPINAQDLWQAMPNNKDFIDTRCIYQDSTTGILYVGGKQKVVGGDSVNFITYWNGTNWESLGNGANGQGGSFISAIRNYNGHLYAGGTIYKKEGNPGSGLMQWDGINWDQVGNGACEGTNKIGSPGFVNSFNEINGSLYVNGYYDTIGCQLANGVATWDGSSWQTVYNFADATAGNIVATAEYKGHLYVAGAISPPYGYGGGNIVYFNGSQWEAVGGGIHGGLSSIWDMAIYKDELYIAGRFFASDDNPGDFIARWDGNQWRDVGGGTNGQLSKLLVYHDKLYVFGGYSKAGNVPAQCMACWDGTKWCGITGGYTFTDGIITAGIYNDTILVAGGLKICSPDDTIKYFAKFLGGDYTDTCSTPVGVSEINQSNFDFSIYPNPSTSQLEITLPKNYQYQQLKITNTLGQLITRQQFSSKHFSVDISELPMGVYFLELQNEKEKAVKKFVKQ